MAVRYASTDDLTKYPYLTIAGQTDLNKNPFLLEALKRKTKKTDALGIAGQEVTSNPMDLQLGENVRRDPSNPSIAYLPGSPIASGSGDMDMSWLQDMLKPGGGGSPTALPDITSKVSKFSDIYKPASTAGSDADFNSYLSSIKAPSSVDAVQKSLEQDYLQEILGQIGRDTEGSVADTKLDFLDRGLGDAGRTSDIEQNAIAQARAGGARTAAGARTQMGMAELARQKAREDELKAALGQKYQTGVSRETQANQIGATGALSESQALNDLLKTQFQGGITTGEGAAGRAATSSDNLINNMIKSMLTNKELDMKDKQFYEGLLASAEQNALQRTATSNDAAFNRKPADPGFWDQLWMNTISGVASGGANKISGSVLDMIPKKKTTTTNDTRIAGTY